MAAETELNSLISSLPSWEDAEYAGAAIVILGVIGEGLHDFAPWFKTTWWGPFGGRLSVLVLVAGLAIEAVALITANSISGRIIAGLIDRAANVEKEAETLREQSARLTSEVGLRHLDGAVFLSLLYGEPTGEYEIVYGAEDPDSIMLAFDLRFLLEKAGWRFISLTPVPLAKLLDMRKAVAFPKNIRLEVQSFVGQEMPIIGPNTAKNRKRTLYAVLSGAIMRGLGGVQVTEGGADPSLSPNRVRVTVFPR